jgi:hypothetical protein
VSPNQRAKVTKLAPAGSPARGLGTSPAIGLAVFRFLSRNPHPTRNALYVLLEEPHFDGRRSSPQGPEPTSEQPLGDRRHGAMDQRAIPAITAPYWYLTENRR